MYQCEECGCAENTACGWYWYNRHEDPKYHDRKLCSACGPADQSGIQKFGEWHAEFERTFYPKGSMVTDKNGNLVERTYSEEACLSFLRETCGRATKKFAEEYANGVLDVPISSLGGISIREFVARRIAGGVQASEAWKEPYLLLRKIYG